MTPAQTTHTCFTRTTHVAVEIQAPIETIWGVLSDIDTYADWNPTIIKGKGQCQQGATIELITRLAPTKTFRLKVKVFEPMTQLVLGNAMGNRTIRLVQKEKCVQFTMKETIKGPLLPLIKRFIPPFDDAFDTFALSLKAICENGLATNDDQNKN